MTVQARGLAEGQDGLTQQRRDLSHEMLHFDPRDDVCSAWMINAPVSRVHVQMGQTIPLSCLVHSLRAVPLINVRVGWRGKIPLTYEWTHWTLKLRRNSVNPPWGKTLNMLEGLHKLTAVLIQTWISSWKEIHVLWMSLHSVCLLLSIVVSLRRERKTTSGIGVCQRNLKNVTVFSNVSWIYHLWGDSASGLYPSSVHKHPPPSLPPSTRLNDYPLLT